MTPDRREFLKHVTWLSAASAGVLSSPQAKASEHTHIPEDPMGVLVDLTTCVGCRLCEYACKKANGIDPGEVATYDNQRVFKINRRPETECFTVVNAYIDSHQPAKKTFVKINCMHCNYPACASACIVGALQKHDNGAVTYDAWKCIGCRYCMVACPFQLPAYSYEDALTPQIRKCQFCFTRTTKGELPGCVEACPRQAIIYGKRNELLKLAHERINLHPNRYIDHIYGEHEVGGTSWMYLSDIPFENAGFLKLGDAPPPQLTEEIQHGVFKHWIAPFSWYGFLATMMFLTSQKSRAGSSQTPSLRYSEGTDPRDHCNSGKDDCERRQIEPERPTLAHPTPVDRKLLTPGVWALITLVLLGVACGLYRFIVGLGAATNLDQQHPWGLWIAMDVGSGIALAGGGFVTAALVHIFHREHYHAIARSALLTALLGYTFYVPGLLADIGRWYNIWHPTIPTMWQGNSVLFEVGLCVMIYLNVQYAEMLPIVCERVMTISRYPRIARLAKFMHHWFEKIMPALLVLGVALSTFHQSSLGNLMVIAPYKLHRLWWTPLSPLLFLISAMMVGFPMVIFTILFASWALKRKPEMHLLAPLARYVPIGLSIYLALKIGDMIVRGTYIDLLHDHYHGTLWFSEILFGVVTPLVMLLMTRVRRSPKLLATASLLVILGVVLNRLNCFVLAYHPPYATKTYVPSLIEFGVSIGLVAALMLTYRVAVTYLPILEPDQKAAI
jgi:Ni/Fe-hydrogenase subunit HybB-like protein/Fe-S-cluster-containing dehydrogenase component